MNACLPRLDFEFLESTEWVLCGYEYWMKEEVTAKGMSEGSGCLPGVLGHEGLTGTYRA